MTLPSQFSLEEENFYKDIQDLVKKGSQNEKELSSFLQRYMDLLARADLDDETFIINFTKAGLIIEASAKVYGTKVDKLWINLEHVIESLKNKSQGQAYKKKSDCEEDGGNDGDADGGCDNMQEEGKRKLGNSGRRKKKVGDALFSSDDFMEIDNITGLLGKNMNENSNARENKIKLCAKVPNMFIKNKTKKKKIDVCLSRSSEDKDIIRLRDWIISPDGLLIKDLYCPEQINAITPLYLLESEDFKNNYNGSESLGHDENVFENAEIDFNDSNTKESAECIDEKNNNNGLVLSLQQSIKELEAKERLSVGEKDNFAEELNVSKESDVAKFPNVLDRLSGDCLVDVDEVFWNSSKFQDVISSKKMRAGKTYKLPCQLCADKKAHKKKGKRCKEDRKLDSIDSYFTPHVQPTLSEPHSGILPDEELYNAFKIEVRLIGHLGKANTCKNINNAYHPEERPEEFKNFLGFDGFENYLSKGLAEFQEDDVSEENLLLDQLEDDNENYIEDPVPDKEFELPFPVTEASVKTSFFPGNELEGKSNEILEEPESEYQKLVIEELRDHYAAKSSFAKNKELGIKISKWHEMIADKIKLSEKRGALNMNVLAEQIMNVFPVHADVNSERPVLTFGDLVKNKSRRDIPRYFFACLQLTNEGNLDIGKSSSKVLATDCMIVTRLKTARANYELEDCSGKSPSKGVNSSRTDFHSSKRKRNSLSNSSSILESEEICKKKRPKQKIVKSRKRPKNFNSTNSSKRRRCSISSADSAASE